MLDFITWRLNEVFDLASILAYKPKDGEWVPPLNNGGDYHTFYFNVPGDDCADKPNGDKPCYTCVVSGGADDAGVSFRRGHDYTDERRGVGKEVMMSVLHALGQFITEIKPEKINWSAIQKKKPNPKTGQIMNADVRGDVYDQWAVRNIFPQYVGAKEGNNWIWVRADIYKQDYVTKGYAPIPDNITIDSNPGEKRKALEDMREKTTAAKDAIRKAREEEVQRRQEEERRQRQERIRQRAELLQQSILDPTKNPHGIAVGDIVIIPSGHLGEERLGKVESFKLGDQYDDEDATELYAIVKIGRNNEDQGFNYDSKHFAVSVLKKETPEAAQERERKRLEELQQFINSPQENPNGVKEGDDIITIIAHAPDSRQNGLRGKIEKLLVNRGYYGNDPSLHAKVNWNDEAREILGDRSSNNIDVEHLHRDSPEAAQERENRRQAELQPLIKDPTKNPGEVKEGDDVIIFNPEDPINNHNGLTGKLKRISIHKTDRYNYNLQRSESISNLLGKVDWDERSKAILDYKANDKVSLTRLRKSTPEEVEHIRQARVNHEIEQQVANRRERQERASRAYEIEPTPEELINDPNNPHKLKAGDYVQVASWTRDGGKKGIIIKIKKPYSYSSRLYADIKLDRMNRILEKEISYLTKDESEAGQRIVQRHQQGAQRRQTIQQANTSGIQIGDEVRVLSGLNRNRTGRVLSLATGTTGNVRATCVDTSGARFSAAINGLAKVNPEPPQTPQPIPTESRTWSWHKLAKLI